MPQPVLIYDANCRLCATSRSVIEGWDRRGEIRFVHFQTIEATGDSPCVSGQTCLDAIRFFDRNGGLFVGADAFVALLGELPMGKPVRQLFGLPGIMPLARWAYRYLAAHRYKWFGEVEKRGLL